MLMPWTPLASETSVCLQGNSTLCKCKHISQASAAELTTSYSHSSVQWPNTGGDKSMSSAGRERGTHLHSSHSMVGRSCHLEPFECGAWGEGACPRQLARGSRLYRAGQTRHRCHRRAEEGEAPAQGHRLCSCGEREEP